MIYILCYAGRKTRVLVQSNQGVAYIEFALSVSVLLLMFLGTVEITRYVLIIQKEEKSVTAVADVVTQSNPNISPMTDTIMVDLLSAVQQMMYPYGSTSTTRVIVTDVVDEVNPSSPTVAVPTIVWQFCGGGTLSGQGYESYLGTTVNGTANLTNAGIPSTFSMTTGEEMIVTEMFYNYSPIITNNIMKAATLYKTAVFMPRFGTLTAYTPNSTISNASNCP